MTGWYYTISSAKKQGVFQKKLRQQDLFWGAGAGSIFRARRGACPSLAGSAGVGGTLRGACPLCRLSPLPLALPFAPIPPTPFPAGRGRLLVFLCKGLRPLHPRGWMGRDTGSTCVWRYPAGGLPSLPPATPAFSLIFCPHPPARARRALFPAGRGRLLVFLCKGLRPLHPRGWMGRDTGSTCI